MDIRRFVNEYFGWIHHAWNNGERALILATAYLVAASGLLVSAIIFSVCSGDSGYSPLYNVVPQSISVKTAVPGSVVNVHAVKCNNSDRAVGIEGSVFLRDRNNPSVLIVIRERGIAVREPGCLSLIYRNPLPLDVPPGRYRFEGIDVVRSGDQVQQEPWYTEDFIVLAE